MELEQNQLNKQNMEKTQIELEIQGMTCASCVKHVTSALMSVNGVESADVHLAQGSAHVTLANPSITPTQLIEAVKEEGYSARVKGL